MCDWDVGSNSVRPPWAHRRSGVQPRFFGTFGTDMEHGMVEQWRIQKLALLKGIWSIETILENWRIPGRWKDGATDQNDSTWSQHISKPSDQKPCKNSCSNQFQPDELVKILNPMSLGFRTRLKPASSPERMPHDAFEPSKTKSNDDKW